MNIKGTAFIARRSMLVGRIGQEAWDKFFAEVQNEIPCFVEPVVASSKIPIEDFLKFNELAVAQFFQGNPRIYWTFGEKSAEWALSEGPYKSFFQSRDVRSFIGASPALWKAYYDEGDFSGYVDEGVVDLFLKKVPVKHVHFEFTVMGYAKRGLELIGTTVTKYEALKGYSLGDDEVHYRFMVK